MTACETRRSGSEGPEAPAFCFAMQSWQGRRRKMAASAGLQSNREGAAGFGQAAIPGEVGRAVPQLWEHVLGGPRSEPGQIGHHFGACGSMKVMTTHRQDVVAGER